jgi:hypothetical protein
MFLVGIDLDLDLEASASSATCGPSATTIRIACKVA